MRHREDTSAAGVAGSASRGGARGRIESCPLCGTEFDAAGQGCRPSCPLAEGCSVVCCPSCGYGFPQERGLAGGLRRLMERFKERKGHAR